MWALALSGYLAITTWRFRARASDPLVAWATVIGLGVALFFFALMLGPANPFKEIAGTIPLDGRGPNPLLQNHPLVAIHPPMLYLGYVGFTIPFSFAVAALITGRFGEGWLADVRRTTLVAWGFLTIGIVLGAWWSYEVLGWGGYWGWDPGRERVVAPVAHRYRVHPLGDGARAARDAARVEPVARARDVLPDDPRHVPDAVRRRDVGAQLHAVADRSVAADVPRRRGDRMRRAHRAGAVMRCDRPVASTRRCRVSPRSCSTTCCSPRSRWSCSPGTVFPLLAEALQDRQLSVGEPYFERLGVPIGIALLFLMAVGPLLPWRAASGELLRKRLLIPAWAGGITLVVALAARRPRRRAGADVLARAPSRFASIGRTIGVGVRARRRAHCGSDSGRDRAHGAREPAAVRRARRAHRRRRDRGRARGVVRLRHAARGAARPGRVRDGARVTRSPTSDPQIDRSDQKTSIKARVRLERGGDDLGVYAPAISTFPNFNSGIGTPSVRTGILQDVYLTLVSSPTETGAVTLRVQINPMVVWLWIGGGIMALGTALALLPARRRRVDVPDPEPLPDEPELVEAAT